MINIKNFVWSVSHANCIFTLSLFFTCLCNPFLDSRFPALPSSIISYTYFDFIIDLVWFLFFKDPTYFLYTSSNSISFLFILFKYIKSIFTFHFTFNCLLIFTSIYHTLIFIISLSLSYYNYINLFIINYIFYNSNH